MKSLYFTLIAAFFLQAAVARADGPMTMQALDEHGLILTSAEYWPYHGDTDINYPDDVLWGFYPVRGAPEPGDTTPNVDTATPEAVACATAAYVKLQAFFASENPTLMRIVAIGGEHLITNKFYLWTNDYSRAANPYPFGLREARLWYWTRSPQEPNRTPGYWKWESVLTQDGQCLTPDAAQIETYLRQKLADLGG